MKPIDFSYWFCFNKCQYIICSVGGAFFTFKQMKKVSKAKAGFKFTNSKLELNTEYFQ
jgi:hypothetical protein